MSAMVINQSPEPMARYGDKPYEPFNVETATKIVIGTICPPKLCDKRGRLDETDKDWDWFYGSWDNLFWATLQELLGAKHWDG